MYLSMCEGVLSRSRYFDGGLSGSGSRSRSRYFDGVLSRSRSRSRYFDLKLEVLGLNVIRTCMYMPWFMHVQAYVCIRMHVLSQSLDKDIN